VSAADVMASLESGDLNANKNGTQWRIPKSAVDQFLQS
jgi:excisionase family DNA binding protein